MWHFLYNGQVGLVGWLDGLFGASGQASSPLGDLRWALPSVALVEVWRMAPTRAFPAPARRPRRATGRSRPGHHNGKLHAHHLANRDHTAHTRALADCSTAAGCAEPDHFDEHPRADRGRTRLQDYYPALYAYNLAVQTNAWPAGTTASWLLVALVLVAGAFYIRLLRTAEEA